MPGHQPKFHFVEIDVEEVDAWPDGLQDIYERRIDGLIVHNVYTQAEVARVADRLTGDEAAPSLTPMPWGQTMGRVLIQADLADYFRTAAAFRARCRELFRDVPDFETRFCEVAGRMSGGRPVEIPRADDGSAYTPATIRLLANGGDLSLHCGNSFLHDTPQFRHLKTVLNPNDQLSYFLTVAGAEAGGELVLYDLEWPHRPRSIVDGGPAHVFGPYRGHPYRPPPGSLLFFDGGRIWHRVSPVEGTATRVTIGGFAAFSLDDSRVYYWS